MDNALCRRLPRLIATISVVYHDPSIAIIGAGLAGLTCGTTLKGLVPTGQGARKDIVPGGRVTGAS